MILIIDFGSQYNQLIARRVRENQVYCRIEPPELPLSAIRAMAPEGIILSGGPASIYAAGAPRAQSGIFELGIPVLESAAACSSWWTPWAGGSSARPNGNTVSPNSPSKNKKASFPA